MKNGSNSKNGRIKSENEELLVEESCGNVFADLGLPNPELLLAKADLVIHIRRAIAARKLSHAKAAELLKLDEDKLAGLIRGRTERFTIDRLIRLLTLLDQQVEITVTPKVKPPKGRASIVK